MKDAIVRLPHNPDPVSIGARIKEARLKKGLTQSALGGALGMTHAAVQQWESGKTAPAQSNLPQLAEALGVTQSWLLDGMVNIHTPQFHLPAFGEKDFPVYGAALGGDGAVMLNRGDEVDRVHRPPALVGVKDAFGVIVSGDSMEPMFLQGDIAWIHPGRPPMPRRGVLIELHDGHAHLKEYISQNDEVVRCRQHNPPANVTYKRRDVKRLYLVVGSGIYG